MSNEHKDKFIDVRNGEGEDWLKLSNALVELCPTKLALSNVLLRCGGTLVDYDEAGVPQTIHNIITGYNAAFKIDRLVLAALGYEEANELMRDFALERGIVRKQLPLVAKEDALERMLNKQRGFKNPLALIHRMQQIVNSICQIEIAGRVNGTGFLIADDVVLTNYHVLKKVIDKSPGFESQRIKLRFDFQTPAKGNESLQIKEFGLVEGDQWLIDHSPYDAKDKATKTREATLAISRDKDCLDYALLKVAGSPATGEVTDGKTRGFIPIPAEGPDYAGDFQEDSSGMAIFQHPIDSNGDVMPLQIDEEKPAKLAMDENQLRVVYDINTTKGSSGSPCFNPKLELIALHHAGGKDWPADETFLYNQGIPIDKIRDHMKSSGAWEKVYDA